MPPPSGARSPRLSPATYRRVTLVALASLALIVVTGAAVRLTGSGLGCSDWPNCEEGQFAPADLRDAPAMVEFVNRLITGIVSAAVILAVLGSLVRQPRRRDLTLLSWGLVVGVLAQILVGAMVVLLHLSPKVVMAHFLLSMVLIWNGVVLYHRAGVADDAVPRPAPRGGLLAHARAVVVAASVVVVTGTVVTATGPHAGDEQASRLALDLPDVARVHGLSVAVLVVLTFAFLRRAPRDSNGWVACRVLLVVIVAQAAVGYTQYFTGVPALLVGVHICGALAVWIAAVRLPLEVGRAIAVTVPPPRDRVGR